MASIHCPSCQRDFSSPQYFQLHLRQRKNKRCYLYLVAQEANCAKNEAEQPQKRPEQRQKRSVGHSEVQESVDEGPNEAMDDFPMFDADESSVGGPELPPELPPHMPNDDLPVGEEAEEEGDSDESKLIRLLFAEYTANAQQHRDWVDPELEAGIELMHILTVSRAPLTMFDKLLDWHIAHSACKTTITRQTLLNKLRDRYNMAGTDPFEVKTTLPSSNVKVKIPCHDAWQQIMDLLTDPRIEADDYLWCNGDPESEPPDEVHELADLTDGRAYRATYNALIRPSPYTESGRRKVLLPLLTYMDGCVTGLNQNLSLELFKFTLGIFTSKAREKEYTWRVLGAVPQFQSVKADAAAAIERSGHTEADGYVTDSDSDEDTSKVRRFLHEFEVGDYINSDDEPDEMCDIPVPDTPGQDLHSILHVITYGLRQIIRQGGFEWDFNHNGQVRRVFLVPFMLLIKGDTVEHDKHTGHYGSRTQGIKCLCRYCNCPAMNMDDPLADYEPKTPQAIKELVAKRDFEGLKAISQHYLFNVWYEFLWGLHNDFGVHGACPMELLHWIQLGMYKYSRLNFFAQTGKSSKLSKAINQIASEMGWLFQRQSDRGFPRTKFTKGIQKGTLMAHEMTGLMLVLLSVLRSTRGRRLLLEHSTGEQASFFPDEKAVANWIMVVELQILFEAWLKKSKMRVNSVIRLKRKVRELLMMIKKVQKRTAGMGFKTNNFHATTHIADDILNFGPPHGTDTKSNEMGHKPDKGSAKRTQKRPKSFDIQSVQQVNDRRLIDMGMEELAGRPRWDYYVGFERPNQKSSHRIREWRKNRGKAATEGAGGVENAQLGLTLTGVSATFAYIGDEYAMTTVKSAMKKKSRFQYPPSIVATLEELANDVGDYCDELTVFSELCISGQTYRAAPHFQGKQWYDWALYRRPSVNEGFAERIVPLHIRCFVDLRCLPAVNSTNFESKVYFIAEPVRVNQDMDELIQSDIFVPYVKEEGEFFSCKAELLPVDRISGPVCVIPDLGNTNPRAFLAVRSANEWANLFEHWINSPFLEDEPLGEILAETVG